MTEASLRDPDPPHAASPLAGARRLALRFWNPKHGLPLIPADSIASRSLVTVIAIMTFLAALTAGSAVLVRDAAQGWSALVSREMTIQIKPRLGGDLEADAAKAADIARAAPGVGDVRVYTQEESARLLEPWLGAGVDLRDLPVPRLIVVSRGEGTTDVAALREKLRAALPNATLDDHRLWVERLTTMAGALVAIAIIILGLVSIAMALAIGFATRGAMAGNREIMDVLHFVGAQDAFIAREFQRHFLLLGLKGGAIGGGLAVLVFLLAGWLSDRMAASPGGEQVEALFGSFSLGALGYGAIVLVAVAVTVLTGAISRAIVYRQLQRLT